MAQQPTRRTFLGQGAALVAAGALGTRAWAAPTQRTLVLLHLAGGNDGFNTLIPFGDEAYYRRRPTLAIAERAVLPLAAGLGLHPKLTGLAKLWDRGELAIVQGVGYDRPSRSHFRSLEIWESGSDSDQHLTTGWLGRALDKRQGARTVCLGCRTSLALQGRQRGPQSLAGDAPQPWIGTGPAAAGGGLAADLARVAAALDSPKPAAAYHVTLGGFDTHARQALPHAALLGELGDGLLAFQRDLARRGLGDRVLTLVSSEFGRQLAENGTRGTDHGTAAPVVLLGSGVKGGLYGRAPALDELDEGQVTATCDYRRVYATVLDRWLGVSSRAVLGRQFETLGCL